MYIELKSHSSLPNFNDRLNDSTFIDRVYQVLVNDGISINYGEFISKYYKNGMVKLLKSLGIYKVQGRGENKSIYVHPRLLIIIETSLLNPELIGKNLVRLARGEYSSSVFSDIDLTDYEALEMSMATKEVGNFSTYMIFNPDSGLYKIGKSKNVFRRFESLKCEFNKGLILIGFCKKDVESEVHFQFKDVRVFGEWFSLNTDNILDIFSMYGFEDIKFSY